MKTDEEITAENLELAKKLGIDEEYAKKTNAFVMELAALFRKHDLDIINQTHLVLAAGVTQAVANGAPDAGLRYMFEQILSGVRQHAAERQAEQERN